MVCGDVVAVAVALALPTFQPAVDPLNIESTRLYQPVEDKTLDSCLLLPGQHLNNICYGAHRILWRIYIAHTYLISTGAILYRNSHTGPTVKILSKKEKEYRIQLNSTKSCLRKTKKLTLTIRGFVSIRFSVVKANVSNTLAALIINNQ